MICPHCSGYIRGKGGRSETRWTALAEPDGVYLFADDFCEHDAALQLTGDFATPTDHLAYAQALADRLNGGTE